MRQRLDSFGSQVTKARDNSRWVADVCYCWEMKSLQTSVRARALTYSKTTKVKDLCTMKR